MLARDALSSLQAGPQGAAVARETGPRRLHRTADRQSWTRGARQMGQIQGCVQVREAFFSVHLRLQGFVYDATGGGGMRVYM